MEGMSGTDALAVMNASKGNIVTPSNGFFGGMDDAMFLVFALLFLNNGGIGGGRADYATQADLAASQNAQTAQMTLANIQSQIAGGQLTGVQTVANQTAELMAQNNANLINLIQGFNNLSGQITNQTNVLSQQLSSLNAKLDTCCCEIKTMMLQNRLADAEATIVAQRGEISNFQQTQNILNQLGRYVPWAGSNTSPATASTGG